MRLQSLSRHGPDLALHGAGENDVFHDVPPISSPTSRPAVGSTLEGNILAFNESGVKRVIFEWEGTVQAVDYVLDRVS